MNEKINQKMNNFKTLKIDSINKISKTIIFLPNNIKTNSLEISKPLIKIKIIIHIICKIRMNWIATFMIWNIEFPIKIINKVKKINHISIRKTILCLKIKIIFLNNQIQIQRILLIKIVVRPKSIDPVFNHTYKVIFLISQKVAINNKTHNLLLLNKISRNHNKILFKEISMISNKCMIKYHKIIEMIIQQLIKETIQKTTRKVIPIKEIFLIQINLIYKTNILLMRLFHQIFNSIKNKILLINQHSNRFKNLLIWMIH